MHTPDFTRHALDRENNATRREGRKEGRKWSSIDEPSMHPIPMCMHVSCDGHDYAVSQLNLLCSLSNFPVHPKKSFFFMLALL
mmetsp:Transcript_35719/g.70388  ORF Transcript_35719/g.70388 Transcript_35719/m.70388 type:complete len:83 (-) Transcript_35719:2715-2963(-)